MLLLITVFSVALQFLFRSFILCHNTFLHLQQNGNVFYSVDANFGLVCKKSSGKSREPPKRSTEIFISDSEVDAYIGNCNGNVQKDELVGASSKRFYIYLIGSSGRERKLP